MAELPLKPAEVVINKAVEACIRQVKYVINYEKHVNDLKEPHETLKNHERTVKDRVQVAKDNAEEITELAKNWLKRVERKMEESKEFHDDKMLESKTSCFSGGCSSGALPFLWHRRQLGRKAKKILAPAIKELNQEAPNILANISIRRAPTFADSNPAGDDYLEFKSREGTIKKVMEQLKDPMVRMVGVHGPSGVGKTSLVQQIAKQAKDSILFEKVAMATVTKDPDLQKVQQDIADRLGLTFQNEGENGRATHLRKRLKQESILVILDNLWDELDLNKIGIPFDEDEVSSHVRHQERTEGGEQTTNENSRSTTWRGCKILVTSSSKQVLLNKMNVKQKSIVLVPNLDIEETFTLFKKVVEMSNENPKVNPEILHNYCAGLPMAVILVGKSLKNKSETEWEGELEKAELKEVQNYMEKCVKMVYDNLESEELKSIFLVCAQMGQPSLIAELVMYCYGLGILKDVHTLKDARKSISNSIQKLKESSLLDINSNDNFNMHDIIRDATLSIACKNQNMFILRNKTLDVWPDKKELKRCTGIHLYKSRIMVELPKVLNCPQLKFFHIHSDDPSLEIPDRFFERMEELRVLVLSGIHLPSLPSSIECLSNLRMLCLEECTLGNLSIINKLKNLRILSLSGSSIEDWSTELEGLCKLQLLDISNCSISKFTRPLSLLSFTTLEELQIRNSLAKMEVEGEVDHSQISALSELKHLRQLNTLDVYIPSAELLPADLFFHQLNDYKIVIGDFETLSIGDFKMPNKYEASRSLALQLEPDMDIHSLKGVKLSFKEVKNLLLGDLCGVQNVFNELNLDGFPYLKHLSIVNNKDIEYIVNSLELSQPQDVFPSLEFLSLIKLTNIKEICCSLITDSSFSRLKTVKVKECPQLKSLFFFYLVKFLANLETIDVIECNSLVEIVGEEGEGSNKVEFHNLRSLTLQHLPSFVSFYKMDNREIIPATDEQNATTSFSLFNENVEIPKLKILKLSSIKIHKIWSNPPSNGWFKNLIKLTLEDCQNLRYLCSLSVACNLKKLKSISICNCSLMEKLFNTEGNNNEYSQVIFPELEEIQLRDMEKLKDIWPHEAEVSADSFRRLSSIDIISCSNLEIIFPDHTKCWYLHLKSLKVFFCELVAFIFEIGGSQQQNDTKSALLELIHLYHLSSLKQVWSEDPKGVVNFTNLQSIKFFFCNTLSNVLPASIAKDLGKLESFSIQHCHHLEEIIACDGGSETTLKFPEVVSMSFIDLPRIRCLYKGRHIVECLKLKQLTVNACPNLEIFKTESGNEEERAFLSAEKVMSNLEHLSIDSKGVEWLMSNTRKYRFTSLKQLHLEKWQSDDQTLYCFLHTIPNLQIFQLGYDHHNIREFVPSGNTAPKQRFGTVLLLKDLSLWAEKMEDIGFERDPALQRSLHSLILHSCYKLRRLAHSSVSFTHLTYLEVWWCDELKTLMTCSTAKSLVQLTTLKVEKCDQLNEIVTKDEQENDEGIQIVFANLINIELKDLTNLTSFCSNENCEFSVPLLEKLILKKCPKMKTFTAKHITAPKLQSVLASETGDEEEKGYWKGDLNATIQMQFADKVQLELSNHPELKQQWCGKTVVQVNRFENVKSLVVKRCGYLVHVIPSHLLRHCFKNLEDLQVSDCDGVQVIFNMDDSNTKQVTKAMGLSRLKILSLENLPNLEHVWDADPKGNIHFQALQDLSIHRCDSLEYVFPSSMAKGLAMNNLSIKNCEQLVKIFAEEKRTSKLNANKAIKAMGMFHLKELSLENLPNLEHVWDKDSIEIIHFSALQDLSINKCDSLKYVFPTFIAEDLAMNNLSIKNCEQLVKIFAEEKRTSKLNDNKAIKAMGMFHLKELSLENLPNLEHVWDKDSIEIIHFSALQYLSIDRCDSLEYVFPTSIAKDLVMLNNLSVKYCEQMIKIFAEDKATSELGDTKTFELPSLTSLVLREVPMLKHFYLGLHKLQFPKLKELYIQVSKWMILNCQEAEAFVDQQVLLPIQQSLEVLSFDMRGEKLTWQLKSQILKFGYSKERVEEVVFEEKPKADYVQLLSHLDLKGLSLDSLVGLKSIGLDHSWIHPILDNIQTLEVKWCDDIKNLVASKVSFSSLTKLVVDCCHGLLYVLTSSTAESLSQLKHMEISNCRSMREIICKEDDESNENIIFEQLQVLHLEDLPMLRWLYSGKRTLCFPALQQLSIFGQLSRMTTFCPHFKINPDLVKFHLGGSKYESYGVQWKDNVDPTIPKINNKKLKCLQLSTLSQLNSIGLEHSWMQQISENIEKLQIDKCRCLRSIVPSKVSFSSLIELNISECNGLVNLFTPATSRTLHQLKNMSIINCGLLKEIVSEEEVEESSKLDEEEIIFKKLETLSLRSLPNLEKFYNGNIALKFPSLIKLLLIDCSKMESFCAGTVSVNRWMEVQFKEDYEVLQKQPFLLEDDLNCAVRNAFEGLY